MARKHGRMVVGIVVILLFGTLGLLNFKDSMTPYVTFAEARTMERTIQIAGFPDHQAASFNESLGAFTFTIRDEQGEVMPVVYKGGKPGNFDQAQSVVVIGDVKDGALHAKQILVKCPSKYEDQGDEHPGGSEASHEEPSEDTPKETVGS